MKRKPIDHAPCRGYIVTPCSACPVLLKALPPRHGAQEVGPLPQQPPSLRLPPLPNQHQWRCRSGHLLFGSLYHSRSRASLVRTTRRFRQARSKSGPDTIAMIIPTTTALSTTRTATEANLERLPGHIAWITPTGTTTIPISRNPQAPVCLTTRQDTLRACIPLRITWSLTHTGSQGPRPVAAPDHVGGAATFPRRRQISCGPGSTRTCTTLILQRMRSSS